MFSPNNERVHASLDLTLINHIIILNLTEIISCNIYKVEVNASNFIIKLLLLKIKISVIFNII